MVGENFGIYSTQMAKNKLKLSTMVRGNFGIYSSQMSKNILKLSTPWLENIYVASEIMCLCTSNTGIRNVCTNPELYIILSGNFPING